MNRQQRRQQAREARRGGYSPVGTCDCPERLLTPLQPAVCPDCGERSPVLAGPLRWHTMSPAGSVTHLDVGCSCGADYRVLCAVE